MKIINTIKRAVRLDSTLYSEIEQKYEYNSQAIVVVILASLFSAVGIQGLDIFGIITSFVYELLSCGFWIGIIVIMAFKVLDIRITPINFARCIAIALFPLLLMILVIIPYVGIYLAIIGIILSILSVFKVVKELLDVELALALVLAMIGSLPFILVNFYLIYQK
jgi:hypothetical protein